MLICKMCASAFKRETLHAWESNTPPKTYVKLKLNGKNSLPAALKGDYTVLVVSL